MDELLHWLEGRGLGQCAEALAGQDIDLAVLPHLTQADVDQLGLSLGLRRKLLTALAELRGPQEAERRQVTVMFCDLVGSTELANAIDPEDMSKLLRRYQDACAGAIARFDGLLAKFLGDGVLAYFGYPHAYEDAAERSVRAALAILSEVKGVRKPDGRPVDVRVGIATGIVVIGDIIGRGIAREHAIVGETPNLAARIQSLGEPNAILLSQSTRNLLGRQFEIRTLGELPLKGFPQPVPIWQVTGEAAPSSRFTAGRSGASARFVGRDEEIASLLAHWRLAANGQGGTVHLVGEAGMGKSRTVEVLRERLAGTPHGYVLWQCSPYHTNSALHPVIHYFQRAAAIAPQDTSSTALDRLEVLLARVGSSSERTASLIAELLSLPTQGRYATIELLPLQRKAAVIAEVVGHVRALSRLEPVLFVLEDAHWMDPTTRDVLGKLAEASCTSRILAIVTKRPVADESLASRSPAAVLTLGRLADSVCAQIAKAMEGAAGIAPSVLADIVAKTDGVPLFAEELTRAVMESTAASVSSVPATLHDSLMARLDRMGPAKEIALVASVIGQQFSRALLEAVIEMTPAELAKGIERLGSSGVVTSPDGAMDTECSFRHALLRDVAYESMLRSRRQQLHERVARALEERFPALAHAEPELLAQHFGRAGLPQKACDYREQAGDRAAARTNYAEAVGQFKAAITEAGCLPESPQRARRELDLLIKLGPALSILTGPRNPEVESLYLRAQTIAKDLGDEASFFKATWGLWFIAHTSRDLGKSLFRAQELVGLGRKSTNSDLLLEAIHCRWSTSSARGDAGRAVEDSREGVERYDIDRHGWMGAVFGGHDPGICAHGVLANSLAIMGIADLSRRSVRDALSLGERLHHPPSLSQSIQTAMVTHQLLGDREEVRRLAKRMIDMADRFAFTTQRPHALFLAGWAQAAGEEFEQGLGLMEAQFPAASSGTYFFYRAALLAEARMRAGRFDAAQALLETALASVTEPGLGFYVPELHRLYGECLLLHGEGNFEKAAESMELGLSTAARQNAVLLQFKSALSLACACNSSKQPQRGLEPLRRMLSALPEGFEAPDLRDARAMLH